MPEIIDITSINKTKIDRICQTLNNGDIIAYPTDTIYGLGVNAHDKQAASKLFQIKNRSRDNPVSILYPSRSRLKSDFSNLNNYQKQVLHNLLPGPFTIILPLTQENNLPPHFQKEGYTGVRIIQHQQLNKILQNYSHPISTTSVNPHNHPPAQNIEEIKNYFKDEIELILRDNNEHTSQPSTIIKLKNNSYQILREGAISRNQVENIFENIDLK